MSTLPQQRDLFWDAAKAGLIILVILGHAIQYASDGNTFWSSPLFKGIYIFHMPLFMLISGYFAAQKLMVAPSGYLQGQFRHLMFPALTLGTGKLLCFIVATLLCGGSLCLLSCARAGFTLWFLWTLFECCLFGRVLFCVRSWVWRTLWLILPMVLALVFPTAFFYSAYFTFLWPFFLLGCLGRHLGLDSESFAHPVWLLSVPPAAAAYTLWEADWYVYLTPLILHADHHVAAAARLLAGLAGSLSFLCCIRALMPLLKHFPSFLKLGQCTLGLYIMQDVFFSICPSFSAYSQPSAPLILLAAAAIVPLCYFLYQQLRRNEWVALFLFGENSTRVSHCQCGVTPNIPRPMTVNDSPQNDHAPAKDGGED